MYQEALIKDGMFNEILEEVEGVDFWKEALIAHFVRGPYIILITFKFFLQIYIGERLQTRGVRRSSILAPWRFNAFVHVGHLNSIR